MLFYRKINFSSKTVLGVIANQHFTFQKPDIPDAEKSLILDAVTIRNTKLITQSRIVNLTCISGYACKLHSL